jgi:DMSO/TMAO reductase YedYZ molybdopterin-dependent catalytic subunit
LGKTIMSGNKSYQLSRRRLLQLSGLAGSSLLLNSCGLSGLTTPIGQLADPLNQRVGELLLKRQALVPEFSWRQIERKALLINSLETTPEIDPAKFQLIVNGAVKQPMQFSLAQLQQLPLTSMIIRHICVEGWAAIVQWGGVRLYDLARLVQPQAGAKYVYFKSDDGYSSSWDIASALHPQTLMAYQMNGAPLPIDNGAPLRLAAPIKLGYKQSKWVTEITFTDRLSASTGYWEDQGYEWFGGL